ncbi:hypothetical protein Hdeb2414_s0006g00202231 [Helianthus debilis subsp. tardiflorus]
MPPRLFTTAKKFRRMEIGEHAAIDWSALEEVQEAVKARDFIGHDTPWSRLFNLAFLPSYRVLVIKLLSSFEFHPRPADQPGEADDPEDPWIKVSFQLAGCGMICLLGSLPHRMVSISYRRPTPPLHRGRARGTSFDARQIVVSDPSGPLWVVKGEGVTYYRPPVPLSIQAYCHIYCTART